MDLPVMYDIESPSVTQEFSLYIVFRLRTYNNQFADSPVYRYLSVEYKAINLSEE